MYRSCTHSFRMFACVNSALMLTQIMALPRAETDMADSMASMIQKYENAMSEVQTLRVEISNLTEAMLQSGIREKHLESVHAKTKEDLLAELAKNVELRKIADMVNLGYKLARERSSTPVSRHCLHASKDLCESLPLYVTYDDPVVFVRQAAHRSFSAAPNFQEGQNGCRLLSGVNASMNHGSTKWKEIDFGDERGSPLTFKSVTDESLSDVGLIERAPGEGTRNSHMAACQNMFARLKCCHQKTHLKVHTNTQARCTPFRQCQLTGRTRTRTAASAPSLELRLRGWGWQTGARGKTVMLHRQVRILLST